MKTKTRLTPAAKRLRRLLNQLCACPDGLSFVDRRPHLTCETVWKTCNRPEWLLWALGSLPIEDDRLLAVFSATLVAAAKTDPVRERIAAIFTECRRNQVRARVQEKIDELPGTLKSAVERALTTGDTLFSRGPYGHLMACYAVEYAVGGTVTYPKARRRLCNAIRREIPLSEVMQLVRKFEGKQ
jgi:hypothetical protein